MDRTPHSNHGSLCKPHQLLLCFVLGNSAAGIHLQRYGLLKVIAIVAVLLLGAIVRSYSSFFFVSMSFSVPPVLLLIRVNIVPRTYGDNLTLYSRYLIA